MKTYPLPIYLQRFFTERLATQLRASPNTVASYRDTFRLLLKYSSAHLGRAPTDFQVADIDANLVGGFLSFVETRRKNSARSRNARLSAIRSFFKYVAVNEPQLLDHCQRVLAMPSKRHEKRTIDYLNRVEIEALIAAPDPATWFGRRDRTLLLLALQTGLRVSELVNLNCDDVVLLRMSGASVRGGRSDRRHSGKTARWPSAPGLQSELEPTPGLYSPAVAGIGSVVMLLSASSASMWTWPPVNAQR
jgi:integrase/recombinase XerD